MSSYVLKGLLSSLAPLGPMVLAETQPIQPARQPARQPAPAKGLEHCNFHTAAGHSQRCLWINATAKL